MDKYAVRQKLLSALIKDRFDGVLARFASAVDIAPSYVSRMLYPPDKAGAKRIGESTIEKIESCLDIQGYFAGESDALPMTVHSDAADENYIAVPHLEVQAGMGEPEENSDFPETIREIQFAVRFLRRLLGFMPSKGRLVLIDGRGDSMQPTIQHGDALLVDTGINHYERDGLYLINLGHGVQIKRLIDRGSALHVCSDNPIYKDFPLPEGATIQGRAYMLNRMILLN